MTALLRRSFLALVLLATSACASLPGATPTLLRTELLFGLSRPGGDVVTDAQWQEFVDRNIAPRFPAGFTVVDASGHYLSHDRTPVRERSKILILVYPSSPEADAAVEHISADYKKLFEQEEVLRVTIPVSSRRSRR
jgi:hypothetical protein